MNAHEAIKKMPKKQIAKVANCDHSIFYVDGVQHITIPLKDYMSLLDDRLILKARKKK